MSAHTRIANLSPHGPRDVEIRGWLEGRRRGGGVQFLLVRDGTGVCQCVVEAETEEAFATAHELTRESSLVLTGEARPDERAPGGVEIAVRSIRVVQRAGDFPITRKAHGVDFLMEHRHLWLRSRRQAAILRLRHVLVRAARDFFDTRGFTLVDTPILSSGAAEGAGSLFPVDYFGETAYLAQTGQLYLESACMALDKVYCFGPTFRAEKSKTRRHLTEFWMIEPEVAWAELEDIVQLAEAFITHLVRAALDDARGELELLGRAPHALEAITPPFPRLTYTEAVERLRSPELHTQAQRELEQDRDRLRQLTTELRRKESDLAQAQKSWKRDKLGREIQSLRETVTDLEEDLQNRPGHLEQAAHFPWGKDLGGAEETLLSRDFDKPLVITHYPAAAKAFYMKRNPDDPRTVLNLDILAPEGYGEIIGGSRREDDLDALQQRMAEEQMDPAPYEWYLDLRRYGSVPHGGFGLGIERTVAWIAGLPHVRETIPFPRLMNRLTP